MPFSKTLIKLSKEKPGSLRPTKTHSVKGGGIFSEDPSKRPTMGPFQTGQVYVTKPTPRDFAHSKTKLHVSHSFRNAAVSHVPNQFVLTPGATWIRVG
jgi:hypothetical protein